ncbi:MULTISPECIES: cysteine desulfurase family protein [Paenibacillus]|uniref:cysteine desulfurase family protein n=1 Tax=Paenibacillus TaxID=44249 RepID=UPI002FE4114A
MKYFDYAATTPPYEEVVRTITEVMSAHYGNPSSLHRYGEESARLLRKAREVCAEALGVQAGEIVFTSGATESNNMAIKGAALQWMSRGKHLITTKTEHPSVFESFKQLERQGWEVTYLEVDAAGRITGEQVAKAVKTDTVLVSVMHVNNETGCVQPVAEIGSMLKKKYPRVLFHVDGVQGFGKAALSLKGSGIDLYSLSAHKIRGPKGIGLLYVRDGVTLFPLLTGGGQEGELRPGTENIPYIVGMAKAIRMTKAAEPAVSQRLERLKAMLMEGISRLPELKMNSIPEGAPHIVHFSHPGMKAEALLHMLEEEGFLVSTKSACSSRKAEPSRVLQAMGKSPDICHSGIRISLGDEHTEQDIQDLLVALNKAVARVRHLKGENIT